MSPTNNKIQNSKGISLLFVVLIMSVVLSIGLGVSGILIQQTRMMGEIGYSVISFYAADSGVERELYDLYKSPSPQPSHSGMCGDASFEVSGKCGAEVSAEDCPTNFEIDPECDALNYCIKSIGSYQKTKRAIEIKY